MSDPATSIATPITTVNSDQLEAFLESLDEFGASWARSSGFKGNEGDLLLLPDAAGDLAGVACGLGSSDTHNDMYALASVPNQLPGGLYRFEDTADESRFAMGMLLSKYRFDRYQSVTPSEFELELTDETRIQRLVNAVFRVRDLVNTPAEHMGPEDLEHVARDMAEQFDADLSVTTGENLLRENFPAIHAVGRAADFAPRLIDLSWGREDAPKVTLVGKGVCFDSGGLDIKGATGMLLMKKDMGGAAHVLALGHLIMESGLDVRLRVLVPAVENAISGNAYRPGDVVATRAGLSIEIGNTDAEGRMVLSDALTLACEESPDLLIDFATLTGAARVALGPDLPPIFGRQDNTVEGIIAAGQTEQDPLWRMPLYEPYREMLKSPIADMSNVGGPMAGCVTAALFLDRFVEAEIDWCHLDVYAWNKSERPGRSHGGEAMGLRAVFAYLENRYGK